MNTSASTNSNVSLLETIFWSLLFYPMVIMAAIGNLLIIWIIATKPLMRNIMNQYLMNLTLSDFLSVTFNASFNFIFMLHQHWPFGKIYCIANNFIANLTIVSSVSTMMLISIDRYYAIVHPLKTRQTKRRFLFSIGVIWALSILFSLPALLYSDTEDIIQSLNNLNNKKNDDVDNEIDKNQDISFGSSYIDDNNNKSISWLFTMSLLPLSATTTEENIININQFKFDKSIETNNNDNEFINTIDNNNDNENDNNYETNILIRTLCIMRWPDGVSGFSTYEFLYNMAFLIFFYIIPVLTMIIALLLMSRVLWPKELIGEHTYNVPQNTLIRSKRKVVCMLICVISVFALCWLPYHSYFISIYWWPSLIKTPGIKHIYLAFYWFAMANSLFNPVILFAMNRRIRNYIKYYVKCSCCLLLTNNKRDKIFRNLNQNNQNNNNHRLNHYYNNYHQNRFYDQQMKILNNHHYYSNRNNNNDKKQNIHNNNQQNIDEQQQHEMQTILVQKPECQTSKLNNLLINQSNGIISNVTIPISLINNNNNTGNNNIVTIINNKDEIKDKSVQIKQNQLQMINNKTKITKNIKDKKVEFMSTINYEKDQSRKKLIKSSSSSSLIKKICNNFNQYIDDNNDYDLYGVNDYNDDEDDDDDDNDFNHHSCPIILIEKNNENNVKLNKLHNDNNNKNVGEKLMEKSQSTSSTIMDILQKNDPVSV